ncbi:hypothetical protein BCV69DRAFT_191999 [Microstroma glucosiphilum]|uniref:Uncharacterized protein n=1 Tax=Pseudomicrostroma glucosiphilum TaxID=1684307 RepID=A0A316U5L0_9BASI|nr:hypothetical protein BCV69DRAFT_191999 [Pseudomicrostroma glucosiphilum]PWN20547.1 hypothetical protein BCV69DRAFT_191999 [Pseudomicrostroma glucosiphilum]
METEFSLERNRVCATLCHFRHSAQECSDCTTDVCRRRRRRRRLWLWLWLWLWLKGGTGQGGGSKSRNEGAHYPPNRWASASHNVTEAFRCVWRRWGAEYGLRAMVRAKQKARQAGTEPHQPGRTTTRPLVVNAHTRTGGRRILYHSPPHAGRTAPLPSPPLWPLHPTSSTGLPPSSYSHILDHHTRHWTLIPFTTVTPSVPTPCLVALPPQPLVSSRLAHDHLASSHSTTPSAAFTQGYTLTGTASRPLPPPFGK